MPWRLFFISEKKHKLHQLLLRGQEKEPDAKPTGAKVKESAKSPFIGPAGSIHWRIPWTEKPGGLHSPWGHKELDLTERLTLSLEDSE